MTSSCELLADAFERVRGSVHRAVDGLTIEQLTARVGPDANTIAWLIWHLTRIQDDHIADVAGRDQVWIAAGFAERFALPFVKEATGFGQTTDEVGAVRAPAELLVAYSDAVHEQTRSYVVQLRDDDLDRVVDTAWNPPVTLAVRLVSVISDDLQHAGQAAFVRGIVLGSSPNPVQ